MTYKFDRHLIFFIVAALSLIIPIYSVIDLFSSSGIDFDAVTSTRRKIPMWLVYTLGWSIFMFFSIWLFAPVLSYLKAGYVFKIDAGSIVIGKSYIKRDEIISWTETIKGMRLYTARGVFFFHPRLSSRGFSAFLSFVAD